MLRDSIRRLIQFTAGYSVNTLVGPIFTLLLTPIYTRVLTTSDYGTVDTLLMLFAGLTLLGMLGLTAALPAFYYDPLYAHAQPQVITSALWTGILWSLFLAAIAFIAAAPLARLALGRTDVTDLLRWLALSTPFSIIYNLQTTVLRLKFAVWRANVLALLYLMVFAAANLTLVVWLRWGSAGVILSHSVTMIVMGLAGIAIHPASLRTKPRFPLMHGLIRTGLPLVPGNIAVWMLVYQDRLFLVRYVTFDQIGVYAIAVKLASALSLLIEPFKAAWGPLSLSIQQQPDASRSYTKVFIYYCVGGLGLALGLSLFAREILLIVTTPAYVDAARYVWLLVLTPLTSGLQTIVMVGLFIEKRIGQMGWTIALAALLNTLLNFLLIPYLGVLGAAIATAVGYLASPLLTARAAQRLHPLPYEWNKAGIILIIYLLLAGVGLALASHTSALSLIVRGLLLCAYLPLLWLLGIFEPWELQLARRAIRQPRLLLQWMLGRT